MKYLVDEMEGSLLNAAVAKAGGQELRIIGSELMAEIIPDGNERDWDTPLSFSTNWRYGGPIIERERIVIAWERGRVWASVYSPGERVRRSFGPTPLIAAMRAYCAAVFGDEVEIP